jgi:acylpyruvate hydrolase
MKFIPYVYQGIEGLGLLNNSGELRGLSVSDPRFPGRLATLLAAGSESLSGAANRLTSGDLVNIADIRYLPPVPKPSKIICVGLNYLDHVNEGPFKAPTYPTLFSRFATSLIANNEAIVRPRVSHSLDYEGELVAIIGKGGRHISKAGAPNHIAGFSVFNDATVREYCRKTTQWMVGKTFDRTGAFGPCLVTADELPPLGSGLRLETRVNGRVLQSASTANMIFDVAELVSIVSEAITLEPGDLIVSGTPAGVGVARNPPIFLQPGDTCEVEIEGIGTLRNVIVDEDDSPRFDVGQHFASAPAHGR